MIKWGLWAFFLGKVVSNESPVSYLAFAEFMNRENNLFHLIPSQMAIVLKKGGVIDLSHCGAVVGLREDTQNACLVHSLFNGLRQKLLMESTLHLIPTRA